MVAPIEPIGEGISSILSYQPLMNHQRICSIIEKINEEERKKSSKQTKESWEKFRKRK